LGKAAMVISGDINIKITVGVDTAVYDPDIECSF
jgi:hypothetical protein